jgi:hypothetical protein
VLVAQDGRCDSGQGGTDAVVGGSLDSQDVLTSPTGAVGNSSQRLFAVRGTSLLTEFLQRSATYAGRGQDRDLTVAVLTDYIGVHVLARDAITLPWAPAKAG